MGSLTIPTGFVAIERDVVAKYPREYAALAYLLEKSGFPVRRVFATRGSEIEKAMKAEARRSLQAKLAIHHVGGFSVGRNENIGISGNHVLLLYVS